MKKRVCELICKILKEINFTEKKLKKDQKIDVSILKNVNFTVEKQKKGVLKTK